MPLSALSKSLAVLDAVIADAGQSSVAAIARACGVPVATAHRHVTALVAQNYLAPIGYGRHVAGPRLRTLTRRVDEKQIIAKTAAPWLRQLAAHTRCVVQLGTLESDMVTYRIKTGRNAGDLFTKVGMQLEAYCSAIGKVLLANLPPAAQSAYLDAGPFFALTAHTITDPALLKQELDRVADQGFALDDEEVETGLFCAAVPVHQRDGTVLTAISASQRMSHFDRTSLPKLINDLHETARRIEHATRIEN